MLKLKEFLVGNKNLVVDFRDKLGYGPGLARIIDTEKGLDYVFEDSYSRETSFNPFSIKENSMLGIYNRNTGVFYFESEFKRKYTKVDYSDLETLCIDVDIQKALIEKVNNSIISKIGNNKKLLKIKDEDVEACNMEALQKKAERMFFYDSTVDMFSYARFDIADIYSDINTLTDYILNAKDTIERLAIQFIEENKKTIYSTMRSNDIISKILEDLHENEEYMNIKKMNEFFGNSEFKTVNVLYKKDGNEIKFKMKNVRKFSTLNDSFLSSYIVDKKDYDKFRESFRDEKELDYIHPEYIEEITHGRRVLYKK